MMKRIGAPLALAALVGLGGCAALKGHHKRGTPTLGERIPILVSENAADVDKTIADVPVSLPDAVANDAWAQPGGNAAKSIGQVALGASPTRAWSATIDGGSNRERLAATPVVADNKLFVIDVDAVVHAIAADTGATLWTAPLVDTGADKDGKKHKRTGNRFARFGGGASYDDGTVYADDGLGDVAALSAAGGKVIWRAKPGGPLRGSPTIANGNVYVLSQDNQLFALDQGTGKTNWSQSASLESQGVFGVAAPASSQGTVVAGFSSGELNAYRYENGRSLWQDALSRTSVSTSVSSLADIDADPVIDQGRVYAVGQGGRMVAIDIATGQRLWEQNFAGISTPWIAGEWLFLVTDDARLVCVARANGKVRWISQLPHYRNEKKRANAITWFGPVLAGGRLVLTNSLGQIVFRSPKDGADAGVINGAAPFSLGPIVARSMLYTLDEKGHVVAYR